MSPCDSSRDREPLFLIRGFPVYVTTVLVALHCLGLLLTVFIHALRPGAEALLFFTTSGVLHGELWRFVTGPFVNVPTLWFLVAMFMIWHFGLQVEMQIGRKAFVRLFVACALFPLLLLLCITDASLARGFSSLVIFVAFCALYPGVLLVASLSARTILLIVMAIYILADLMWHDWSDLIALLAASGTAFAIIRYEQGRWTFRMPRRSPRLKVLKPEPLPVNVDAILDKVAKSGLESLTRDERAALERARSQLLNK